LSTSEKDSALILSLVIPLYNEAESLAELHEEITSVCSRENISFEIIYVDDGSIDNSFEILEQIHAKDKRVKVIQFRSNCGKSDALYAGFQEAAGKYIITMDADLQDNPEEIPNLIKSISAGYDLVSGWKRKRHDPINKRLPSKFFNRLTSWMSGVRLHDFNCGLKIYRRDVARSIKLYGDLHRYIPALAHLAGYRVTELEVNHRPRKYGKTKYGFSRSRGMLDLLTVVFLSKYNRRPLHLFGLIGFWSFSLGFCITLYLIVLRLLKLIYLSNRPLLFIGIMLMIVGVQFVSTGLIGEMITRSMVTAPEHSISKKLGL